ncbi:Fpg/Nei family DNA glycosylase [Isoptericola dokdonensis]|uniref:Putative formamidopyrimidine-DNA glycosylase-like protein n=1 Tax=Isoptericola dokdonensis DS-3 TaxID=1300344 RepID=A0A161HWP4_9MICO|nr:DNA-formamidopyrimidine glycosylase family protein [Isoptericola dokdonensis]ANC30623.1 putative formamidopyrimidine-DNA glycosylase-like protein [Isoptericola dokdonensis DS-3]
MPELPEVEALVRFLGERTGGHRVVAADVAQIAALKTYDPPVQALVGRTVVGAARHGKWLDLALAADGAGHTGPDRSGDDVLHLVLHLSRGGWVRWSDRAPTTPVRPRLGGSGGGRAATLALRVRLDDGSGFDVTEAGTRKRLAVHVVREPDDVEQVRTLGVDPLSPAFTPEAWRALVRARNQQVKGLLRDQHAVAGIGNAYSDEILHAARTSPFRLTGSMTDADVAALRDAVIDTLRAAVEVSAGRPAAELKDAKRRHLRVHGRTGQPCEVCGDTVREVSFADSSLQYCPTCQTGGKPLADRRLSRLVR